jgi:Mg2+ and Co2+ transporter CorA
VNHAAFLFSQTYSQCRRTASAVSTLRFERRTSSVFTACHFDFFIGGGGSMPILFDMQSINGVLCYIVVCHTHTKSTAHFAVDFLSSTSNGEKKYTRTSSDKKKSQTMSENRNPDGRRASLPPATHLRSNDSADSNGGEGKRRAVSLHAPPKDDASQGSTNSSSGRNSFWRVIKETFIPSAAAPAAPLKKRSSRVAMMAYLDEEKEAGRTSPTLDFAGKDKSAVMKVVSTTELRENWKEALDGWGFPAQYVEQYANTLAEECVSVEFGAQLEDQHFEEMKIKIGHRKEVRQAAAVARRSGEDHEDNSNGLAAEGEQDASTPAMPNGMGMAPQMIADGAEGSGPVPLRADSSTLNRLPGDMIDENDDEFHVEQRTNSKGIRWNAVSGGCRTLAEFYSKITSVRQVLKFPKNFDRAFLDNKPMPFQDQDGVFTVVVLRIPDLTNEKGSTVATISNRLVMMFSAKYRTLLTYHRCDVDPLERLAVDWEGGVHANSNVFQLVDAVNRCVMKVFRYGLRQLQEHSDDLEDETDMVQMVEGLTLVQKKAAVYKRCLNAGRLVLEELQETRGLEDYIPLICETAESYEAMMDEVAENALGSINMQMALDGFHSSRNTKVFTYISLVCQPITLATGWYGMNFVNMPELEMELAYFVFIAVTISLALFILLAFLYKFEFKGSSWEKGDGRSSAATHTAVELAMLASESK